MTEITWRPYNETVLVLLSVGASFLSLFIFGYLLVTIVIGLCLLIVSIMLRRLKVVYNDQCIIIKRSLLRARNFEATYDQLQKVKIYTYHSRYEDGYLIKMLFRINGLELWVDSRLDTAKKCGQLMYLLDKHSIGYELIGLLPEFYDNEVQKHFEWHKEQHKASLSETS